jgi:hypothetical protein
VGKVVAKTLPPVGVCVGIYCWSGDVEAKGPVYGTVNTVLDSAPVICWIKFGVEYCIDDDMIPDIAEDQPTKKDCP